MNEETYEALQTVLDLAKIADRDKTAKNGDAIKQVESWIDEVAKEYNNDETMSELTGETDEEYNKRCSTA